MASKNAPKVVTYAPPTGRSTGVKRPREEADERAALLGGAIGAKRASAQAGPAKPRRMEKHDDGKREDFKAIWSSVQNLGAGSFEGRDRKAWEAKNMNALGAGIKHKIKMPMKMWRGVQQARQRREAKAAEVARVSGVVTGKKTASKSSAADKHRRRSFGRHDDDITPDNIRGPVMYVGGSSGGR